MATKEYKPDIIPSRHSSSGDTGYSTSPGAMSLPRSMKEVGERISNLAQLVEELQNERDNLRSQIGQRTQLPTVSERDADEGLKQLEDDSEENESICVRSHSEQPESSNFLSTQLHSLGECLQRQGSEKIFFTHGQSIQANRQTQTSDSSLRTPEECTESLSENEQLKRQVEEMQATIDELSRQLAEAHINYPDAELSSGETSESLSRVEEAVLIRSQSMPEKLLTAHRKIELLTTTYDHLMAEKKETESALESSLKTVQSLDDSLDAERFEKFKAVGEVKQLKTELEGLKRRVSKNTSQKTESYSHACSPHQQDEGSLMSALKTLREQLARAAEESTQARAEADDARKQRREMKEQLDRTVSEKLVLKKELTIAKEDADLARQERRAMKDRLDRTFGEKLQLEEQVERLATAKADADKKRREMKDQLDHTVGVNFQLEDQVEEQKRKAKDWKMKLDETTCLLLVEQEKVGDLRQRLQGGRK